MDNSDDVKNELQRFMDWHFEDSSVSNWRQTPACNDLFKIYSAAKKCGMTDEDLVNYIRTQWNISLQKKPSSDRQRQVDDLCQTLSAWDLYERCSS